jgi:hypothetical protein
MRGDLWDIITSGTKPAHRDLSMKEKIYLSFLIIGGAIFWPSLVGLAWGALLFSRVRIW